MRNLHAHRKALLVAALVALLLIGPGAARGTVLCLGGDGHIAWELSNAGDCVAFMEGQRAQSLPTMGRQSSESHCGTCVDIPMELGSTDRAALTSSLRAGFFPLRLFRVTVLSASLVSMDTCQQARQHTLSSIGLVPTQPSQILGTTILRI